MLHYRTLEEFSDRYLSTIIYFKGEPIYITDVYNGRTDGSSDVKFLYQKLPYDYHKENKQFRESVHHPDFTDVPNLGYANSFTKITDGAETIQHGLYLTKIPVRRNKQGLYSENLHVPRNNSGKGFTELLYSEKFVDMLCGKYTTFDVVKNEITKNPLSFGVIGFDPQFALEFNKLEQLVLYYRHDPIAYSLDGDKFTLTKSKRWLAEVVEEKGLKVA